MKDIELICEFIRRKVSEANANGVVIGLSGGVDSSLVLALCVKALGKDNVFGLILPTTFTPKQDIDDAQKLAHFFGVLYEIKSIDFIHKAIIEDLPQVAKFAKVAEANVYSRIRMVILYYYANYANRLVVGTSDKSEMMLGYFTKYGDGGVDFEPIAHLYKTEVREMLKELVPTDLGKRIAEKESSPQLYPNHKATDELPCDYELIDTIFKRIDQTEHKRRLPEGLT